MTVTFTLTEDTASGVWSLEAHAPDREALCNTLRLVLTSLEPPRSMKVVHTANHPRGERNTRTHRTDAEVWAMAAKVWGGMSCTDVAKEHGVNYGWLNRVVHGHAWSHLYERAVREGRVAA